MFSSHSPFSFSSSFCPQASGEAHYVDDKPIVPKELFGAFVLAEVGNAVLKSIDDTAAMSMPGVRYLLTAADLPAGYGVTGNALSGGNGRGSGGIQSPPEPLFVAVGDRVLYNGQPIGMILATTQHQANAAAQVGMRSGGGGLE